MNCYRKNAMTGSVRTLPVLLCALVLLFAGCAHSAPAPDIPPPAPRAEIAAMMEASAEAWNRGSLDGFLEPYLDSEQTTFVGRDGLIRGKDAIRALYRRSYWEDGARPEQTLRFENIEVRPLGQYDALATGRYLLFSPTGEKTAEGIFSLVLTRTPEGWRIIHDHSS